MTGLPTGLYAPAPQDRVTALGNATCNLRALLMAGLPKWPLYSPGSLNAWLVFLGPSPGCSPGDAWRYDPLPSIGGAHPGVADYLDTQGFWNGIRKYARAVFPELRPAEAYAATMVRNLDPQQSATAPTGRHMYPAAVQVVDKLDKLIRPQLIVALGGARKFTDQAIRENTNAAAFNTGVLYTTKRGDKRAWFSLTGSWSSGEPFLYLSPSGIHPSLRHVSEVDSLGFLRQQSDVARGL